MELYILRHGTTAWNQAHRLQGRADIPLDEHGIHLAEELGEAWKQTHFDLCYTSPLIRARQTAELALIHHPSVPILIEDRIQEMNFGHFEGNDVSMSNPDLDPLLRRALSTEMEVYPTPEDGESPEDVIRRTHAFYEELRTNPELEDKRILISTHGAAGRALMTSIWGPPFWHGRVPANCSVCIVTLQNGVVTDIQTDVIFYQSEVINWYK